MLDHIDVKHLLIYNLYNDAQLYTQTYKHTNKNTNTHLKCNVTTITRTQIGTHICDLAIS